MEFNEVENLSEEQIAELYSDVVQGPEPVLLSAPYGVPSYGLYYTYQSYGEISEICYQFSYLYKCPDTYKEGDTFYKWDECLCPSNGITTIRNAQEMPCPGSIPVK